MGKRKLKFRTVDISSVINIKPRIEKKMILCQNQSIYECKHGKSCVFIHIEEDELIKKLNQPRKTKMCKFLNNCKRGENCTFAHDESELYKPPCKFGLKCKKKDTCTFVHPPEPQLLPKIELKFTEEQFPIFVEKLSIEEEALDYTVLNDEEYINSLPKKDKQTIYFNVKDNISDVVAKFNDIQTEEFKTFVFSF